MGSHELNALLEATEQRELGFLLLTKLHNDPASLSFHEGEIHYIEDSVVLRVSCPLQPASTPIRTASPHAGFPFSIVCAPLPWTSSLTLPDFSLGMVSLFAQPPEALQHSS